MWKKDFYVSVFLLVICVPIYLVAYSYPHKSSYFPQLIVGLLALMSFALLCKSVHQKKNEDNKGIQGSMESTEEAVSFWKGQKFINVVFMLVVSVIYLFVLPYVGFFLTSIIYLPLTIYFLGVRKLRTIGLSTFIVLTFIYLIFIAFLNVPLPTGIAF